MVCRPTRRPRLVCATALALVSQAWLLAACDDEPSEARDAGHDAATVNDAAQDAAPHDAATGHDAALDAARPSDAALDAALAFDASDGSSEDAGSDELSLADTGLYSDFASETLASGVQEFTPRYALWSDGATKRRFFYLPPNTQIDTTDMDAWVFPVGTKAWKEFTRGGVRVETRLIEKTDQGWFMVAFVWNAAQTRAVARFEGEENANGTQHDVPASATCHSCHDGMPDRVLGVGAIQLSHGNAGMNLGSLMNAGKLTTNPAGPFALPGTTQEQDTLGALHANCGHCHAPTGTGWSMASGMTLRLSTSSLASLATTTTYSSTVGQALVSKSVPGATQRIVKGSPSSSGLYLRLTAARPQGGAGGSDLAMPPLATELSDGATEALVNAFITNLP